MSDVNNVIDIPDHKVREVRFSKIDVKSTADVPWAAKKDLEWSETDESEHSGVEYTFSPQDGFPPLRVEWKTQLVGLGLQYLFLATSSGGDYSMPGAVLHPDDDSYYRDCLLGEFLTADEATCVAEMVRRYRNWLNVIHPDPTDQLVARAAEISGEIVALAREHADVTQQLQDLGSDVEIPGIDAALVQQIVGDDPSPPDDLAQDE